jgi:ABC-type phosphate transport system substrate-binding protein
MDIKRITAVAAFLAAGASAASAGAQALQMKGSDTLEPITKNVIGGTGATNPCSVAALTSFIQYIGTGSSNGENAIIASGSVQYVAPMSRALGSSAAVCTGHETTAQGIKFARDGLVIVADTEATHTCGGGNANDPANPGFVTNSDLGAPWKHTLRVLFTGLPNNPPDNTGQDCNSAERNAFVNAYSTVFPVGCTPASTCTKIRHLYRRGDASGTTDTFLNLIGAPSVTRDATTNAVTKTPFCNGGYSTVDATLNQKKFWETTNGAAVPDSTGLDKSDDDLIRVNCGNVGSGNAEFASTRSEQVCEFDGTLGLLLPIVVPALPASQVPAGETEKTTLYNGVDNPTNGVMRGTSKPLACGSGSCCNPDLPYYSATGGATVGACGTGLLCSSELKWQFNTASGPGGTCYSPAAQVTATNFRHGVINGFRPFPATNPGANRPPSISADPRAWNLWVRSQVNSTGNSSFRTDSGSKLIQAAYYRIHTNSAGALNIGAAAPTELCQRMDETEQIGCLSQSGGQAGGESCSFGFAGRDSVVLAKGEPMELNGIPATIANIQDETATGYPLARNLYINSVVGFGNIPGAATVQTGNVDTFTASTSNSNAQFNLAKCFSDAGGTSYDINAAVTASGFVIRPTGPACVNACGSSACTGGDGASASSAVAW